MFGRAAGTGGDQCFLQWKGERMSMRAAFVICATALAAFALPGFFQEKGLGEQPLMEWGFRSEKFNNGQLEPTSGTWPLRIVGEPKWEKEIGSAHFSGSMDQGLLVFKKGEPVPKFNPEAITLEAWVRLDCGCRRGGLIGMVDDNRYGGAGFSLGYDEDRFRFGLASEGARKGDGVLTWIRSQSAIRPGVWTHLAATYDGSTMCLYVNGRMEAKSTAQQGPIIMASAPFVVGGYQDDDERVPLVGSLKSAALFDKALDVEAIVTRVHRDLRLISLTPATGSPYFLVTPYLQFPTTDSIRVGFETSEEAKGLVEYGEEVPLREKVETPAGTMHHATLEGLKPSTSYFYRVTATTAKGDKIAGQLLTFKTAAQPGESFNFAVFGDSQRNRRMTGQVATRAYENRPSFLLHLGDVVDDGADKGQWLHELFRPCQELLGRVAMMPTIGNHEKNHPLYYQYFNLPDPEFHYKFTWGDADFFAIDSNKPLVPGKDQMAWLEKELAASKARWKFCFHHHPCYSSDSDDYGDSFNGKKTTFGTEKLRQLASLYERHRVDMVMNGHIHAYERTFPIKEDRVDDSGVVYLTSGGFGGGLENFTPTPSYFKAANRVDYHMVLFTIHGNSLQLRAFDKDGQLFDSWTKTK